ncbi:conserved hypothetical protein [Coccidioides posadasii str. Silveira]|uniref:Uncharacterized protein n=1 Tax=Coccidioides posadasii (strain RMSCC 757 / Silveira) TaxID=443226 RepID=E9CYF7_COCPS|nr:conserved hypothetical protein [Coccidioides posadasii str. Silveira]
MLRHKRGLFMSTNLRITSLEKRINSAINLAFNLVVQRDSKLMLQDSLTMDTLATVTLIFLPVATVGTVFGSQFLGLDTGSSPPQLEVAKNFWIFWVVLAGISICICFMTVIVRRARLGRIETWQRRA